MAGDTGAPTLFVRWDRADDATWMLRLFEYAGTGATRWDYPPAADWQREQDGGYAYRDHPVSGDSAARGRADAQIHVRGDKVGFAITLHNDSPSPWTDAWCWICLIHRWAPAFQANSELPVGDNGAWTPCASLEAPMERWLKWCPVAERRDVAGRIGAGQPHMWQPHIEATQPAVRAWRMHRAEPVRQFIELSSPDAIILGWSYWPCTDMGLWLGTINPGDSATVRGTLAVREEAYEPT